MTVITESQWVDHFGFQRFPFDHSETGNKEFLRTEFLASCFVEPRCFERVFGEAHAPVTALLFGARGMGKTACRVMIEYFCQHGLGNRSSPNKEEPTFILSIPHVHLDQVRDIARRTSSQHSDDPPIQVEHHAIEIMRQAVPAFVDMIARNTRLTKNMEELSKGDFEDLRFLLTHYSTYLSLNAVEFLNSLARGMESLRPISGANILQGKRLEASPLFHLEHWSRLMPRVGICSTYVLIDGVDGLLESASDLSYAHYLIRSLLTHLRLMDETPYFALKFFLPSDIEPLIISDPSFRLDRGLVTEKLEWKEKDLIKILHERLNALRRPDFEIRESTGAGLDALCVPDLRGQIEQKIVGLIGANPRQLMHFSALMVLAHCSRDILGQDDPYQLNRQDFDIARQLLHARP